VRWYQVATAAVFVFIAAVAMSDSRRGALIGATRDPGGIGSGFYPFWSAAVIGIAALLLIYRISVTAQAEERVFASRQSVLAVGKLAVPMIVAGVSILWLGFYLAVGAYSGFFARYIGQYRWLWVGVVAIAIPLSVYLVFELGFRMLLPKSMLYGYVLPI
jgi:hypothetical protein